MKKALKWIGIVLAVVFLGMQAVQPERTNPPVDESNTLYARINTPPEVRAIIDRSCSDCHSHNTRWPWYSYVAPVSWFLADDVKEARSELNLSDWGQYQKTRAIAKLDMMCQEVLDGKMPFPPYLIMHPGATLSQEEIDLLCDWVETERDNLMQPDTSATP
ncbi:MAG: heme-binding domain-containing protein [Bacteroidota bacterium]